MKFISRSEQLITMEDLRQHIVDPGELERSPGVHMGQVLRWVAVKVGELKVQDDEDNPDKSRLKMAIGMAVEGWLAQIWIQRGMLWQPGEVELHVNGVSIAGTPDGITPGGHDGEPVLEEFKCTWYSCSNLMEYDRWMWRMQAALYCAALGIKVARWHAVYVNGDYSRPYEPRYYTCMAEFSEEDLRKAVGIVETNLDGYLNQGV